MAYLTLDVGGTFIKYALMEVDGTILKDGRTPTPRTNQADFYQTIDRIHEQYPDVEGIAISLPGTINTETSMVHQGGSLQYNNGTYMAKDLTARYGKPVEIENDARCAALAELWQGNLQGISKGLVLVFGTGVGGALVLDGKLYKGAHLLSGEVSMLFTKNPFEYGLASAFGEQGGVPNLVKKVAEAKQVSEEVDGITLFKWIEEKDEIATKMFQEYCFNVVLQLHNMQIMIDPERICIGGGISAQPLYLETIKAIADDFYSKLPIRIPRAELMTCKFRNHSNLIGALYHLLQKQK